MSAWFLDSELSTCFSSCNAASSKAYRKLIALAIIVRLGSRIAAVKISPSKLALKSWIFPAPSHIIT